ncbi:MAG: tRNA pseudouridine(38-40) synthase TruA [Paramuribaculum sp.]|nr:tRNA pseudouridine(38-40) synthase TruA [Paramuribaculum sp.]
MPRYFMLLAYNGAPYHGWQSQPNAISVQQTVESALATILQTPTPIVGAGRTDAGVNARYMVAHFDSPTPIYDTKSFLRSLNILVGKDIAIYAVTKVHDSAHARFDATERSYRYFITDRKSPFDYNYTWLYTNHLDFDLMNEAAAILLDVEDFTSFAKLHTDNKTNICHVKKALWMPADTDNGHTHIFEITADRFLRNMVRAVVGTLIDVGRGKTDIEAFRQIILAKNRCSAGTSMPAHALYLWDIKYPYYTPDDNNAF